MGAKKLTEKSVKRISLDEAMALSEGYFTNRGSLINVICRGKLTRYGPKKRTEIDYFEFMEYMGRPL